MRWGKKGQKLRGMVGKLGKKMAELQKDKLMSNLATLSSIFHFFFSPSLPVLYFLMFKTDLNKVILKKKKKKKRKF